MKDVSYCTLMSSYEIVVTKFISVLAIRIFGYFSLCVGVDDPKYLGHVGAGHLKQRNGKL